MKAGEQEKMEAIGWKAKEMRKKEGYLSGSLHCDLKIEGDCKTERLGSV